MLFTDGKDRIYENMMQRVPNFNKRTCGEHHAKFRYRFRDLDCRYCAEYKTCPPICLCPYILDNLPDLNSDREFAGAVLAADMCETPQKRTLIYIRELSPCV